MRPMQVCDACDEMKPVRLLNGCESQQKTPRVDFLRSTGAVPPPSRTGDEPLLTHLFQKSLRRFNPKLAPSSGCPYRFLKRVGLFVCTVPGRSAWLSPLFISTYQLGKVSGERDERI